MDEEIGWETVVLEWHGPVPEITDITTKILADCRQSLWGLAKVESLIFHTVFLADDVDHHVVHAWGVEGDERLHVEYQELVKWVSLGQHLDDDGLEEDGCLG